MNCRLVELVVGTLLPPNGCRVLIVVTCAIPADSLEFSLVEGFPPLQLVCRIELEDRLSTSPFTNGCFVALTRGSLPFAQFDFPCGRLPSAFHRPPP